MYSVRSSSSGTQLEHMHQHIGGKGIDWGDEGLELVGYRSNAVALGSQSCYRALERLNACVEGSRVGADGACNVSICSKVEAPWGFQKHAHLVVLNNGLPIDMFFVVAARASACVFWSRIRHRARKRFSAY